MQKRRRRMSSPNEPWEDPCFSNVPFWLNCTWTSKQLDHQYKSYSDNKAAIRRGCDSSETEGDRQKKNTKRWRCNLQVGNMDAAPALFSSTFNEAHIIALAERSARPLTMQGTSGTVIEYWQRVKSFWNSSGTMCGWMLNKESLLVSPYECARFGFRLHNPTTLICTGCKRLKTWSSETPESVVDYAAFNATNAKNFHESLQASHHDLCPFSVSITPEEYYRVDVTTLSARRVLSLLTHRWTRLIKTLKVLPALDTDSFSDGPLQPLVEYLSRSVDVDPVLKTKFSQSVISVPELKSIVGVLDQYSLSHLVTTLALAIVGWTSPESKTAINVLSSPPKLSISEGSVTGISIPTVPFTLAPSSICCEYCNRVIHTESYPLRVSDTSSSSTEAVAVAVPEPKRRRIFSSELDPVEQHSWYCPYVATPSQEHAWKEIASLVCGYLSPSSS